MFLLLHHYFGGDPGVLPALNSFVLNVVLLLDLQEEKKLLEIKCNEVEMFCPLDWMWVKTLHISEKHMALFLKYWQIH